MLGDAERSLFWQQRPEDQRHALSVARRVLQRRPGDRELGAAALLHDVGKRTVTMGAWHRSAATVLARLRWPMPASYSAYCRHGPIGAADLERVGSSRIAVEFARAHPSEVPPDGIDPDRWAALLDADRQ